MNDCNPDISLCEKLLVHDAYTCWKYLWEMQETEARHKRGDGRTRKLPKFLAHKAV